MDRRMRISLACWSLGLGLWVAGTGCRNLAKPEVPPEPPYNTFGAGDAPQVGFSSEPAGANPYGAAMAGANPAAGAYGANPALGNPPAMPGNGAFGASPYAPGGAAAPGAGMAAGVPDPEPLQSLPGLGAAGAGVGQGLNAPADPAAAPAQY